MSNAPIGGFGPLGNMNAASGRPAPSFAKFKLLHKEFDPGQVRDFTMQQWSKMSRADRLQIVDEMEQQLADLNHLFGKKAPAPPKPAPAPIAEPAGWGDW